MMNQKEAVYSAVIQVVGDNFSNPVNLTKEQKTQVRAILVEAFIAGEVQLKNAQDDINEYVGGLLNNWLRKDTRLNGGSKYEAKNPGSRQGSGDSMLRELKKLAAVHPEDQDIKAEIEKRQVELAKAKAPVIDFTKLPEALRNKFQS